jgi:hypothetical protein
LLIASTSWPEIDLLKTTADVQVRR